MKRIVRVLGLVVLASGLSLAQDVLPKVGPADAAAIAKLNRSGAVVQPIAADSNLVSVNFSLAGPEVTDLHLKFLAPVAGQTAWLNLAGTGVTDAGLVEIAGLRNLRRLHLEKTAITDAGLAHLQGLGELRYLNLYGTKVTEKGVKILTGLNRLQTLYVWQTDKPVNATCPVKGEVVEPDVTFNYKGQPIGFCCPECEGAFEADPSKYIGRVAGASAAAPVGPVNAKCPVSGEDVDAEVTFDYEGRTLGFCCPKCKDKFSADPSKYLGRVDGFKALAAVPGAPVNAKCPVKGEDVDPDITYVYQGRTIGFCCPKCRVKFEADPSKYIDQVAGFKTPAAAPVVSINAKCPVKYKDVDPDVSIVYQRQVVGFCCPTCKGKFEADPSAYIAEVDGFLAPAPR